jgi:hypothetical protein
VKKVLGIYDNHNKLYVQRELHNLSLLGYNTELHNNETFSLRYNTPCFICTKNGSIVSKLFGKYSSDKVSVWVRNKLKVI